MKLKNIIIGGMVAVFASSCSLEPEIYDQLSPENALATESDVRAAVTGIYHELRGGGWTQYNCAWGSLLTMQVGCTDECDCNWNWDVQIDYLWTPSNMGGDGELANFYNSFVPAITRATSLIERMRSVSISAPVKRRYTAEVRCLRAMWAYDLYDLYGPLPIITDPDIALDPEAADAYNPERPTAEWYVDFVETELKEVQENLQARSKQSGSDYGRMTKGIAQMYLLKLYLHEAGQEEHYRNNHAKALEWWEKVDSITNVMINVDREYSLQEDYMSIWSPTNQQNSEVIFPVPNFATGGLGNMFLAHTLPADYTSKDGVPLTRWEGFLVPWEFYNTFDPDDKRREGIKTHYWNGKTEVDIEAQGKQPFPMKYQENPNTTGQYDASEYVINRYAEVILARAEAINELEGPTEEAKKLVHQIRRRAFDNYDSSEHYTEIENINDQSAFREHILKERGWEFYWEGMRRPDLIRHGKLIENAVARGKSFAEDKHILYSIPQSAIYENPNLKQNEGYL